jgi:hypothetical protein
MTANPSARSDPSLVWPPTSAQFASDNTSLAPVIHDGRARAVEHRDAVERQGDIDPRGAGHLDQMAEETEAGHVGCRTRAVACEDFGRVPVRATHVFDRRIVNRLAWVAAGTAVPNRHTKVRR